MIADAKRLLDEATPLPWSSREAERANNAWIGSGGEPYAVSTDVSLSDAALIVYAVNRLPDYEAAVDALERLLDEYNAWNAEAARAALARLQGASERRVRDIGWGTPENTRRQDTGAEK